MVHVGATRTRRTAILLLIVMAVAGGGSPAQAVAAASSVPAPRGSPSDGTAQPIPDQYCVPGDHGCTPVSRSPRSTGVTLIIGAVFMALMLWRLLRRWRLQPAPGLSPILFKLYAVPVVLATLLAVAAGFDGHIAAVAIFGSLVLGLPSSLLVGPTVIHHPMPIAAVLMLFPVYANLLWLGLMTWWRRRRAPV